VSPTVVCTWVCAFVRQLKDFASAIRDYTKALQIDPTNAYAFYNRGISHDRNGDFNRAIEDFTAAIRLLPHNADFYHNRGFCFRKKVGEGLGLGAGGLGGGGSVRCVVCVCVCVCLNGRGGMRCFAQPWCCSLPLPPCYQGDYESAISDYGKALKIDPRHFKAVYNRGFSYDKV
jgi:tetratricopeptide (TPR) repeat protein